MSPTSSIAALGERYLEWIAAKGFSPRTVSNRRGSLRGFQRWAKGHDVTRPSDVTKALLEEYQRFLHRYLKSNGKPLTFTSQSNQLQALRGLFKWAAQ